MNFQKRWRGNTQQLTESGFLSDGQALVSKLKVRLSHEEIERVRLGTSGIWEYFIELMNGDLAAGRATIRRLAWH